MYTNLRHNGRNVDALVILPPVQAAFFRHIRQVNINTWQQASLRETLYIIKSVSGAFAGHQSAAVILLLQRDAAVPPRGGEVEVRGYEAPVWRRVGEEHDGQAGETVGDGAQTQEEKHLLLEKSPFPEEGGCSFIIGHVCGCCAPGARSRAELTRRTDEDFGVVISKAAFLFQPLNHPPHHHPLC